MYSFFFINFRLYVWIDIENCVLKIDTTWYTFIDVGYAPFDALTQMFSGLHRSYVLLYRDSQVYWPNLLSQVIPDYPIFVL